MLHGPAVCAEAAGGPALVSGAPSYPDLLPGKRRMEIPADLRQNSRQRLTVSLKMCCFCLHGPGAQYKSLNVRFPLVAASQTVRPCFTVMSKGACGRLDLTGNNDAKEPHT